jgi:hypothetical protein
MHAEWGCTTVSALCAAEITTLSTTNPIFPS